MKRLNDKKKKALIVTITIPNGDNDRLKRLYFSSQPNQVTPIGMGVWIKGKNKK